MQGSDRKNGKRWKEEKKRKKKISKKRDGKRETRRYIANLVRRFLLTFEVRIAYYGGWVKSDPYTFKFKLT